MHDGIGYKYSLFGQFMLRHWCFAEVCYVSGTQVKFLKMGLTCLGLVLMPTTEFLLAAGEVVGRLKN